MKKIKLALMVKVEVQRHNEALSATADKKKFAARAMNAKVYNELILAIQGDAIELTFEVVEDATIEKLAD